LNQCSVRLTTLTTRNVFHSSLHLTRYTPYFYTVCLGLYFSLEWIALSNHGCVTSNVWKSRQETLKFVRVIRMFFTVSVLICVFLLVQTSFISEKTLSVAARHCSQHCLSLPGTPGPGRLRQNSTILKTLALLVEVRKLLNPSFVDRHVLTLLPCAC